MLSYNHGSRFLTVPFEPEKICMMPASGRIYHPGPKRLGGLGLISDKLGILWTSVIWNWIMIQLFFSNDSILNYSRNKDLYLMMGKKIHQLSLFGMKNPCSWQMNWSTYYQSKKLKSFYSIANFQNFFSVIPKSCLRKNFKKTKLSTISTLRSLTWSLMGEPELTSNMKWYLKTTSILLQLKSHKHILVRELAKFWWRMPLNFVWKIGLNSLVLVGTLMTT